MPDAPIHTTGEVVETRSELLCRVALPNGKAVLAHLDRDLRAQGMGWQVGDILLLEMTAYDFDGARIIGKAES